MTNPNGRFGIHGGQYVPELLMNAVKELEQAYEHYRNDPEFQAELTALEDLFRETTGKEMPKFYRPPQGCYSEENLKNAQALGYKTVFWSLAYADWDTSNQPTHQAAYDKLLPRVHNGAIILLHSTSATNAELVDDWLTKWASEGYRFESLDKVFS